MRNPTLPSALLGFTLLALLAAPATAIPVLVTLQAEEAGGPDPLSFTYDMDLQGRAPYDFHDLNEFSGDYILKEEDYRINIADYFRVEMAGFTGYGYNWLLERWPRDFGIYEEYAELRFFGGPSTDLVLMGSWTNSWDEGTPLHLFASGGGYRSGPMRIASIREVEPDAVPEPGSLALMAGGLAALAALGARARRKP